MPATEPENSEELLDQILNDGIARVCAVYKRPPLPSRLLRDLYALAEPLEARRFIASYQLSPSDLLETFASEVQDEEALAALVKNPRTPPHCISQLIETGSECIRTAAASNQQLTARDMDCLVADAASTVRTAIAGNLSLKVQFQAKLATDTEAVVRLALAQNPNLDIEIATALTTDQSALVRCELIAVQKPEEELLSFWADCDREEIQLTLLKRKALPEPILASMLMAPQSNVVKAVLERYEPTEAELLYLAEHEDSELRLWVAHRETLSTALQRILVQDAAADVRLALAKHASIDPEIARYFITVGDIDACAALALNPAAPEALLCELAKIDEEAVQSAFAYREDIESLEQLLSYLLGDTPAVHFVFHMAALQKAVPGLDTHIAQQLAKHEIPSMRAFAAKSEKLPTSTLARLAQDPAKAVRQSVAANMGAVQQILEHLALDAEHEIADSAQATLKALHRKAQKPIEVETIDEAVEPEPTTEFELNEPQGLLGKLKSIF